MGMVSGTVGQQVPLPIVHTWEEADTELTVDTTVKLEGSEDFVYLRITQSDGHQAWVSPIWMAEE